MATKKVEVLITDDYLKTYSPLPDNYNLEEVRPYIHVAEMMWIQPIIGVPLYEELLEQVNENKVTPENATLLLNIYPLLGFATVYESLPFIAYHTSQVGITKGKSDNSDSVSINDVNYINSHLRNQCETMKKLLKKFLDDHADVYPLYYADTCDCGRVDDCDCDWIYQYYGDGTYDRYAWQRAVAEHRMKKFKPNSYNQLYGTRRHSVSMR